MKKKFACHKLKVMVSVSGLEMTALQRTARLENPPGLPVSSWWQRLDTPLRHRREVAICYSTGHFATTGRKPDLQRETRHCIPPDSHVEVLTAPPPPWSQNGTLFRKWGFCICN